MIKNICQKIIITVLIISFIAPAGANYSLASNGSTVLPSGSKESQISWAKERQEKLLKLMETDPQSVIDQLFSQKEINKMPEHVKPYMEEIKTVSGTIIAVIEDNFEQKTSKTSYQIKNGKERLPLYFAGEKPDLTNSVKIKIKNAARINGKIIVPAPTNDSLQTYYKTSSPRSVTGQKKLAVILFNFQDNTKQPFAKETVRKKAYDDANDYYKEISFNKLGISGYYSSNGEKDIYGWYTIAYNASDCDYNSWSTAAKELAVKNNNFRENNYSNIMYFFPYNENCRWSGLADVGSLNSNNSVSYYESWINGDTDFIIITHELGHNFGAMHAKSYSCYDANKNIVSISDDCDFKEYGDPFDVMGTGSSSVRSPYHMSSFNKTQLDWLDSQNIQKVEKNGTFTLVPIEQKSSGIQAIKIPRGTYSESSDNDDYYFLEYRQRYGYDTFDREESDSVVSGISIRLVKSYIPTENEYTYLIDTTPGSNDNYNTFQDAALQTGETFKDDIANIEIKTISVSNESAEVEIKTNYTPVCSRANPSLSIDPYEREARAGDTLQYTLTLTNNDNPDNCESSVFNITPTLYDDFDVSQSPSSFKMTMNPKETKTQTFTITFAKDETKDGAYIYKFIETAVNESDPEFQQSATAWINISFETPIPETPANFKAEAGECGSKSIELTWDDVEYESGYLLTKTLDNGKKSQINLSKNTTSYTDKNVKTGYEYYYKLEAFNFGGSSGAAFAGPIKVPSKCEILKTLTIKRKGNGFGKITIINKSNKNKQDICDLSSENTNKCEFQYAEKSKLKLQAQNLSGSIFKKWIDGCSGTSKTCAITLSTDKTIGARFAVKNKKTNGMADADIE